MAPLTLHDWDFGQKQVTQPFGAPPLLCTGGFKYPVFKATETRWADAFFATGSLRIGTVWDFRRRELGARIGDENEGIRAHVIVEGVDVITAFGVLAKDCYTFCTSEDNDPARFAADGYDAVYRINSAEFFIAVARELQKIRPLLATILAPVIYATPKEEQQSFLRQRKLGQSGEDSLPPAALMKPKYMSNQREVRAVFEPVADLNKNSYPEETPGFSLDEYLQQRDIKSALASVTIHVPHARRYADRLA